MRKTLLIINLLFFACSLWSQKKFENEDRIKAEEAPLGAQKAVNLFPFDRKIKWYREQGLESYSFEAKSKYQKKRYSVEFDSIGKMEDVEIQIKANELPDTTLNHINKQLGKDFTKYKIRKIQIQYQGRLMDIVSKVKGNSPRNALKVHYELVVKGKTESDKSDYEYLFSADGQMVKRAMIVLKNSDHLEF